MSELGLYYDKECIRPVEKDDAGLWQIEFGKIDVGDQKAGVLYLKNRTIGQIEDIDFDVGRSDREGVEFLIRPENPNKSSLMPLESMKFYMHILTDRGVKVGKIKTPLRISATLTEEEIDSRALT